MVEYRGKKLETIKYLRNKQRRNVKAGAAVIVMTKTTTKSKQQRQQHFQQKQ